MQAARLLQLTNKHLQALELQEEVPLKKRTGLQQLPIFISQSSNCKDQ